jgi:hypothetical protein
MGLADHVRQQCSPDLLTLLVDERPLANPDGGLVGEAASEPSTITDKRRSNKDQPKRLPFLQAKVEPDG